MADATVIQLKVQGDTELRSSFSSIGDAGQRAMDSLTAAGKKADDSLKALSQSADVGAARFQSYSESSIRSLTDISRTASSTAMVVAGISTSLGHPEIGAAAVLIGEGLKMISTNGEEASATLAQTANSMDVTSASGKDLTTSLNENSAATDNSTSHWKAWTAVVVGVAAAAGVVYVGYKAVSAVMKEADDILTGNRFALSGQDAKDYADRLDELSVKTGMTTASLRYLTDIQDELGISEEQSAAMVEHLTGVLDGTSPAARSAQEAIKGLGVDLDGVTSADYPQVLDDIVEALNGFKDGAAKNAAALAIFGTNTTEVMQGIKEAGNIFDEATQRSNAYADATIRLIAANEADIQAIKDRKSWLGQLGTDIHDLTTRTEEFRNAQAYAAEEVSGSLGKFYAVPNASSAFVPLLTPLLAMKDAASSIVDYMQVIGHGIAPTMVSALVVPDLTDKRPAMPASPEQKAAVDKMAAQYDPQIAGAQKYKVEMASLNELYKAGAMAEEQYLDLSKKITDARDGDTEKARLQTQALIDMAAAALNGPAAMAQQAADNAAKMAIAAGVSKPVADDSAQAKLDAQQDQRRNASIFSLTQETTSYKTLTDAIHGSVDETQKAVMVNAAAAEQAAGGTRNIQDWTKAWDEARAAKVAYADAAKDLEADNQRSLAEAALNGPAAVAKKAADNAAQAAIRAGSQPDSAMARADDQMNAQLDARRNASIFTMQQEANAYRALSQVESDDVTATQAVATANAVASEVAAGGTRNIEAWTAAYVMAQEAKSNAKQQAWIDGIERETEANTALANSYRQGDQAGIDSAAVQADIAAKATAAHRATGIAIADATAELEKLNLAKKDASGEQWLVGLQREITANTALAEAIRTGDAEVVRRVSLAKEAGAAHDKFGVSIAEATSQLERQHAAMASPAIAKHLADMKAEADLQDRIFAAAQKNDPAAARQATIQGQVNKFDKANPEATSDDKAMAAKIANQASVNAQRQQALGAQMGLDPAAHRAAAQAELDDLAKVADAEGHMILTKEDVARRQSQIDQDYQRGQIDNLMSTNNFANGAQAAMLDYINTMSDKSKQGFTVVQNGLKGLENGLVGFIDGTKSAKQAFTDFVTGILNDLTRMAIQQAITGPLSQMLGMGNGANGTGIGSENTSGGMFGGIASLASKIFGNNGGFAGSFMANIFHDGGIVGMPTSMSGNYPASLFASAPRFHTGGTVGGSWLSPDEVPIIAKKGEMVVPEDKIGAGTPVRQNQGMSVIMNITTPDANSFRASKGQMAAEVARAVTRGRRNL